MRGRKNILVSRELDATKNGHEVSSLKGSTAHLLQGCSEKSPISISSLNNVMSAYSTEANDNRRQAAQLAPSRNGVECLRRSARARGYLLLCHRARHTKEGGRFYRHRFSRSDSLLLGSQIRWLGEEGAAGYAGRPAREMCCR
jgi:hypothetical protein